MNSMTGYGRGESAHEGRKLTVEVSSLNRKQVEVSVNLPRDMEVLEPQIREETNRLMARGRLIVRVSSQLTDARIADQVQLNRRLAKAYYSAFTRLAKELKVPGPVSLDLLARCPGVLQADSEGMDASKLWPGVKRALDKALKQVLQMRKREGAHLAKDLTSRIQQIRKAAERIQKRSSKAKDRYRDLLMERVKEAGVDVPDLDDERLVKEVVFFAERTDISEELTRLQSHFQQFNDCVKSREPVGRKLDFLAQEMNREINTIGAKANDALISREVVHLKTEVERFREQVQNVE